VIELSPADLLGAWERGRDQVPAERALTLLHAARPGVDRTALADLTVGRRDAALLDVRVALFGPRLVGVVACPRCAEQIELAFDADDIRIEPPEGAQSLSVESGGFELEFRLPTGGDLVAIAGDGSLVAARRDLLRRCAVSGCDGSATIDALSETAVSELAARMAEADRQADVELAVGCPSCAHEWRSPFDIVSFLWREVAARALAALREVNALAAAYGWSEGEILALSPARRGAYLGLIGA
jgi:hypothetical protein